MSAVILILVFGLIIGLIISSSNKKNISISTDSIGKTHSTESNNEIKIEVTFPHPELANDYSFYKFIEESTSVYILDSVHKYMIRRGMKLKPEFEIAIQTKFKQVNLLIL